MALFDSYTTGDDSFSRAQGVNWIAQSFLASADYSIESVQLLIYREGDPGTVTVSIRGDTTGEVPVSPDLAAGTFVGSTLTTDSAGEWKEITFSSPASLVTGTRYHIVVRAPTGNATNCVDWRRDSSTGYATGSLSINTNNGTDGSWSNLGALYDQMFQTYGTESGPSYVDLTGTFDATGSLAGTVGVATAVNLTGTFTGTGSVVGTLEFAEVINLTGTLAGTGSISSTLTVIGGKPSAIYARSRLIVIGSNALWYET